MARPTKTSFSLAFRSGERCGPPAPASNGSGPGSADARAPAGGCCPAARRPPAARGEPRCRFSGPRRSAARQRRIAMHQLRMLSREEGLLRHPATGSANIASHPERVACAQPPLPGRAAARRRAGDSARGPGAPGRPFLVRRHPSGPRGRRPVRRPTWWHTRPLRDDCTPDRERQGMGRPACWHVRRRRGGAVPGRQRSRGPAREPGRRRAIRARSVDERPDRLALRHGDRGRCQGSGAASRPIRRRDRSPGDPTRDRNASRERRDHMGTPVDVAATAAEISAGRRELDAALAGEVFRWQVTLPYSLPDVASPEAVSLPQTAVVFMIAAWIRMRSSRWRFASLAELIERSELRYLRRRHRFEGGCYHDGEIRTAHHELPRPIRRAPQHVAHAPGRSGRQRKRRKR